MTVSRVLVTNDDGIGAPGIAVMEKIARTLCDDVWVVAPDFERSGASRSVSLAEPIRTRQIDEKRFALLRGTPTDCVVYACDFLMKETPPTLVLSGINRGANVAEDLSYSGTVAAAMEASMMGIRAISMSQIFEPGQEVRWAAAEKHAPQIIRSLLTLDPPRGVFHNVNFPDVEPEAVRGVRAAPQGNWEVAKLNVHSRVDARNFPYAWLNFTHDPGTPDPETDIGAAYGGWISVSPLHSDLTHHESLAQLREIAAGISLDGRGE